MRRGDRLCLLLAAGLSLGAHATAAVWLSHLSPSVDGLNVAPAQIVQISVITQRAATQAAAAEPPPEAAPVPEKRTPPPKPVSMPRSVPPPPPRIQPERARPAPAPQTVASLPAAPATPARQTDADLQKQESLASASAAASAAQESYLARLLAHIDSHKFYPRGARRRGQEGDVHVTFYLQQNGEIRALDINGGSRLLREAAERAVQSSLPLPKPPASLNLHEQVSFSMQFRLKG
jgi:protein TonB